MDYHAVDHVGVDAPIALPHFDIKTEASVWMTWPEDFKLDLLQQMSRPAEGRHAQYLLNTLSPDEIVVTCLKDIVDHPQLKVDARMFHGKPMLAICLSGAAPSWTLAYPNSSPVAKPQQNDGNMTAREIYATQHSGNDQPLQQQPAHQVDVSQRDSSSSNQPLVQYSPSGTARRNPEGGLQPREEDFEAGPGVGVGKSRVIARRPRAAAGVPNDGRVDATATSGQKGQGPPED
ncbi:hypothetical protein GGS26DRAFT_603613 [Hypomontagnella submonticulosa]|nr:hypothetical protein GGS26DRAFT_603613 [Hypomontagnella submonticulosa]